MSTVRWLLRELVWMLRELGLLFAMTGLTFTVALLIVVLASGGHWTYGPRPATIGGGGQGGSATVIGQGVAIGGAGGAEGGSGVIGHCSKPFIQNGVRVVICNAEAVR